MNIALIANDRKKQLMIDFCLAHAGILCRHNLFATGTTGKLVEDMTGLKVHRFMPGRQGGDQQIASRASPMTKSTCSCFSGTRLPPGRTNGTSTCSACATRTACPMRPTSPPQRLSCTR